jgi:hypothetical protein
VVPDLEAGGNLEAEGRAAVEAEEGPVHRPLIRATLPRVEGRPPAPRPGPDFTIRQPAGRGHRFRSRHHRAESLFHGGRPNGGGPMRGGPRQDAGRSSHRRGSGRKRSK